MSHTPGGTYENILFFNSRFAAKDCNVQAGSQTLIEGGIYCPTGHLTFGGSNTYNATSTYMTIIADTILINGNPELGMNYTGTGRAPTTSIVMLVE